MGMPQAASPTSNAASPRANRSVRPERPTAPPVPSVPPVGDVAVQSPDFFAGIRSVASTVSVLVILVATAALGRAGHQWLVTTPAFDTRDVEVTGLVHTSRDQVIAAGGLGPTRNILSLDQDQTARAIEGLPWVAHASVLRRLPGTVRVTVEERTAVAVVSAGGLYLAGADGVLFKRAVPGDPSDLPVVTGITREDFERDPDAARECVRDALALLADVDAASTGTPARVEEIHRDPTGDLAMVTDGAYVWLGRGPYRAKLTRLRVVLGELRRHGLDAAEIHLESDRHPERITVRPRRTG